jgi:hypothetical protein
MAYVIQKRVPNDKCAICMESLKDGNKAVIKTQCSHYFHNNCMLGVCDSYYPNIVCPICRTPLTELDCNLLFAFKEKALDTNTVNNFPKKMVRAVVLKDVLIYLI